jgi:hypothetical protein
MSHLRVIKPKKGNKSSQKTRSKVKKYKKSEIFADGIPCSLRQNTKVYLAHIRLGICFAYGQHSHPPCRNPQLLSAVHSDFDPLYLPSNHGFPSLTSNARTLLTSSWLYSPRVVTPVLAHRDQCRERLSLRSRSSIK